MRSGWSRRRFLFASGAVVSAAVAGAATIGRDGLPAFLEDVSGRPMTTSEARLAGWTVVTDHGAVGDGRSRPLRERYRTLGDARRDFPSAATLDDELDGVAIQSVADRAAQRIFYPEGRFVHNTPLVVRSGQRHVGAGASSVLENVRPRVSAYDDVQAHSFQIGNIHPAAMNPEQPAQAWATRRLAPVRRGDTTVSLLEPLIGVPLGPGDIVMVRSDGPPTPVGNGVTYDFEMWNRVVAIDARRQIVTLELPTPRDVAAGPTLCVNAGTDLFMKQPWSIAQNVEIANLRLESAGLTGRNGIWRGWFHDLDLDAENMITVNALVLSTIERITGTWAARMIEVKHASHGSTLRDVRGTYRASPGAVPVPAISVGEQSFDCVFERVDCTIGPDCRAPIRALELSSQGLHFSGTLRHFGAGEPGQVWAVKSNDSPTNPPADIDLALVVRSGGGLRSYGLIGNDTPRVSDPTRVTLRLDQRVESGAPPPVGVEVARGSAIRVLADEGDRPCAVAGPTAQLPEGARGC